MKHTFSVNCIWIALIVSSVLMLAGCTEPRTDVGPVQSVLVIEHAAEPNESDGPSQIPLLEDQWGIQVERAVLSAGGYMVDFRFRVLDATKAAPLLIRAKRPYIIDQATGATFVVPSPPKIGQLRSGGQIREGKVYFILFANPAKYIKTGNKVTIVVGDFQARDVVVQ